MELIDITKKLIGKKYELGRMDCLHLIYDFLSDCGCQLPTTFEGYNINTYANAYLEDRESALDLMIKFFESFMQDIPIGSLLPGDVVIMNYKNCTDISSGIFFANCKILTATLDGVKLFPMNMFNMIRGFRCQH